MRSTRHRQSRPTVAHGVVGVVLAVVAALIGFPGVSIAQDTTTGSESTSAMVLVLDASSSMLDNDVDGGVTRMEAAKDAAREVITTLPTSASLGMLVYGTESDDRPESREKGCQDIRVLAPVRQGDRDGLTAQIDGVGASGYTPIGESLRRAAAELPSGGQRSIVLISDGQDTCAPPDPCDVAKELDGAGVDLAVHSVGFKVDDDARAQLTCISQVTGGTYADATDTSSLTEVVKQAATRAITHYEVSGTKVDGTSTSLDAPQIGDGQWIDDVPWHGLVSNEKASHYRLSVPPGYRADVAVSVVQRREENTSGSSYSGVTAKLYGEHKKCNLSDLAFESVSAYGGNPPATAYVTVTNSDDKCESGKLTLSVTRSGGWSQDQEVPVEILVRIRKEPTNVSQYPPPVQTELPEVDAPIDPNPQQVQGGPSFNEAVVVQPGSYRDDIVPGESRFYRVPVQWGQRPVVTAGIASEEAARGILRFHLYNPVRAQLIGGAEPSTYDVGKLDSISLQWPVRYRNRQEPSNQRDVAAVAGQWYVVVSYGNPSEGAAGVPVPFQFAVDTPGQIEEGPELDNPEMSAGTDDTATNASAEKSTDTPQAQAAESDETSTRSWWIIVLPFVIAGVLILVVVGAAVGFLVGRRRDTTGLQAGNRGH